MRFYNRAMCPNDAHGMAKTPQSDLGLHCLLRPVCAKTYDHYGKVANWWWNYYLINDLLHLFSLLLYSMKNPEYSILGLFTFYFSQYFLPVTILNIQILLQNLQCKDFGAKSPAFVPAFNNVINLRVQDIKMALKMHVISNINTCHWLFLDEPF